jgi:NAD(P)-dependent dehydrogenase (short-subunit alcohol dehydrogenase family)
MKILIDEPLSLVVDCETDELAAAYARHQDVFGRLHICINNAGVFSVKVFYEDDSWRKMIDVNLTAVIDGTSKAVHSPPRYSLIIPIPNSFLHHNHIRSTARFC